MKRYRSLFAILSVVFALSLIIPLSSAGIVTSGWQTVGSAGISSSQASYNDIAVDEDGTPYVAFKDSNKSGKVTVMKYTGSAWVNVGSAGFSAGQADYISLALDSDGTPYVAFSDNNKQSKATVMKYTGGGGSGWVNVGNAGFSKDDAEYLSLAFDATGTPHVAFRDDDKSDKATVMKYTGGGGGSGWANVGSAGFSGGSVSYVNLAFDGDGTPYVAFRDANRSNKATVMKYTGSDWVNVGSAGFSADDAAYVSLAIDSDGTPYVAFSDDDKSDKATVMKYNGSAWVNVGSAGFSTGKADYVSIAIDKDGVPYVAFQDSGKSNKAVVKKYAGTDGWEDVYSDTIYSGSATYVKLALDGGDNPYVVFRDGSQSSKATVVSYLNQAPAASNAEISGDAEIDAELTGSYDYSDAEKDAQGVSTYKWYRSDDSEGTGKQAIEDADAETYTVTIDDLGKYLSFEVTPVALAGKTPGTAAESSLLEIPVPTVTVSFDAQEGSVIPNTQDKLFGSEYGKDSDGSTDAAMPTPTRNGYTFGGWWTEENGAGTQITGTDSVTDPYDHTLYAKWTQNIYNVTYNGNGSIDGSVPTDGTDYVYEDSVTVLGKNTLTKTGWRFDGWNTAANGTGTTYTENDTFDITDNITLYAVWTEIYTITYGANDATSGTVPSDGTEYDLDATVSVLGNPGTLKKLGYTYIGWNTAADGTGTAYDEGDTFEITSNVTLYATWIEDRYVFGTETDGVFSTPITPDDASVIGNVIVDLGDMIITAPGSLFADLIGDDEDSYLRFSQAEPGADTLAALVICVGEDNSVVVSFDIILEKVFANGDVEQIHELGGDIEIVIKLTQDQIDAISSLDTAKLYWYNPVTDALTEIDADFDLVAGTVTLRIDHLSTFLVGNIVTLENVKLEEPPYTGGSFAELSIIATAVLAAAGAAVSFIVKKKNRA